MTSKCASDLTFTTAGLNFRYPATVSRAMTNPSSKGHPTSSRGEMTLGPDGSGERERTALEATLWVQGADTMASPHGSRGDQAATTNFGHEPVGNKATIDPRSRYQIIEEVGRGSMGVVYRARHIGLDKQVALKVLLPGAPRDRFLQEARLLARIDSRNVVHIHDFDLLPDGRPMLVMEWIDGGDLAGHIREHGAVSEDDAIRWMRDTARGMLAAANKGVIHRDLKPSNIFIDQQSRARVLDFGLARDPLGGDASIVGEVMGSPWYMAPEQAEDPRGVDTRADIYSFGATFYHALTGRPAFNGPSWFSILQKHKAEPLTPPQTLNQVLTQRTGEIIERCMAKSPGERFASFAEVLNVIDPVMDTRSPWDAIDDADLNLHLARYHQRRATYLAATGGPGQAQPFADEDVYEFPGGRTLVILQGNIVRQQVAALVSSDDEHLTMRSGVSRSIREAAGEEIFHEAQRYVPVRAGRAVVTTAGTLHPRFVFHGITLRGRGDGSGPGPSRDLILEILASCIYHAETLRVDTIALPLLATGNGGFSREICLDTLFRYLARELLRGLSCVREVRIVLY